VLGGVAAHEVGELQGQDAGEQVDPDVVVGPVVHRAEGHHVGAPLVVALGAVALLLVVGLLAALVAVRDTDPVAVPAPGPFPGRSRRCPPISRRCRRSHRPSPRRCWRGRRRCCATCRR